MVRMMTANIQDSLSLSGSIKVDSSNMPTQLASMVEDGYLDYDVAKDLQGDIDYLVIDGTLPVEPTRNAETWMNMLQIMSQTGLNMEYNAGQIAEEAIRAMGITDLDRFRVSKEQLDAEGMSPSQQLALMEKMRGASVQPNEQVQNEVQKGNLIPMSEARRA
jgi:predicted transcriptional regulator